VLQGMAKVIVIDDLEQEPDAWYLADTRRPIKPLVYQKRRATNFVALTALTDERVVHYDEYVWGADCRDNAGYGPWFLSFKARA
jgi:phage major head subunit gpT-like protein